MTLAAERPPADDVTEIDELCSVELFRRLNPDQLRPLARQIKKRKYRRNQLLWLEEESGRHVFVVRSGRVKVSRLLPNGREMILAFHGRGESFGEMDLIDGQQASAMVTAVTDSELWMVPRALFQELMVQPPVKQFLFDALCGRLRSALAQIEVLNFYHAESRIRTALYHLCGSKGKPGREGVTIDMRLTHKDLAEMSGITRETATRVLRQLRGDGLLRVDSQRFVVTEPQALIDGLAGH